MFTGIIEQLGKIVTINEAHLKVESLLTDVNIGDSVALNGVCLTATSIQKTCEIHIYSFDLSPETYNNSTFKQLKQGSHINMERAMKLGDRLGGHMISGHIEAITTIRNITEQGGSFIFEFNLPKLLARYMIYKGSIAIDGISLTVADLSIDRFSIAVIPHTYNSTNLKFRKNNDDVNLETDMVAKYVENLNKLDTHKNKITPEFLKENGF